MERKTEVGIVLAVVVVGCVVLFLALRETTLTYENPSYHFRMQYPKDWTVEEKGNAIVFMSPRADSSDFQENVVIIREELSSPEALDMYVGRTMSELVKKTGAKVRESWDITLSGLPARQMVYTATIPYGGKRYTVKWMTVCTIQGTTAYILTYTALEDTYQERLEEFQAILDSFTIIS